MQRSTLTGDHSHRFGDFYGGVTAHRCGPIAPAKIRPRIDRQNASVTPSFELSHAHFEATVPQMSKEGSVRSARPGPHHVTSIEPRDVEQKSLR